MSWTAFAAGFAKSIEGQIKKSQEETSALRRAMVGQYSKLADDYQSQKLAAGEMVKTEEIYKSMGLPSNLASLAAYSKVTPDKLGAFMEKYEVVDGSNVRDRNSGSVFDVNSLTGQMSKPAQVPVNTEQPTSGGSDDTSGGMGGAWGRIGDMLGGRGNMAKAREGAISDVASLYAMDPDEMLKVIASGGNAEMPTPDLGGLRPKLPDEYVGKPRTGRRSSGGQRGGGTGTAKGPKWTQSDMNNIASNMALEKIAEIGEDHPDYMASLSDPGALLKQYESAAKGELYRMRGEDPTLDPIRASLGTFTSESGKTPSAGIPSRTDAEVGDDGGYEIGEEAGGYRYMGGGYKNRTNWQKI